MILCGSVMGRARKRKQQQAQDLSLVIGDQVVLLGDNPHKKEQIQAATSRMMGQMREQRDVWVAEQMDLRRAVQQPVGTTAASAPRPVDDLGGQAQAWRQA